jgi:hypothetical protein
MQKLGEGSFSAVYKGSFGHKQFGLNQHFISKYTLGDIFHNYFFIFTLMIRKLVTFFVMINILM